MFDLVINPYVLQYSELEEIDWEYCISFPNLKAQKKRSHSVRVSYLNEKVELIEKELSGFYSRVFLHEYDHLFGKLLTEGDVEGNCKPIESIVVLKEAMAMNFEGCEEGSAEEKIEQDLRSSKINPKKMQERLIEVQNDHKKRLDFLRERKDYLTIRYGQKDYDPNIVI